MGALDDYEAELSGLDAYEKELESNPAADKLKGKFGRRIAEARGVQSAKTEQAPAPQGPEVSTGEAFTRGVAGGGALGFDDEIAGVGATIADIATRDPRKLPTDAVDLYRENRDAVRQWNQNAEESKPGAYLGGSFLGGLATAPLAPGGAGWAGAVKGGAAIGGATGVGRSEADLTKPSADVAVDLANDTASGALTGAAIGGVLQPAARGLAWLFRPAVRRAAEALGAGRSGNIVAQDVVKAVESTGQEPSIASLGAATPRAAQQLRRLFTRDPDAASLALGAERAAVEEAMATRSGQIVPEVEASMRNSLAAERDAALGAVSKARENVGLATEEALNRRAASSLNNQRLAAGRESDRIRESLLTGREVPRSRGNNPREVIAGAAESARGTPRSSLVTEAKESLAKTRDAAKGQANAARDTKELLKPDSVARERAQMRGMEDVLTAQRSRLMENEIPGKFSQKALDQLLRDGDEAGQALVNLDKLIKLNQAGNKAVQSARPGVVEQLAETLPGKVTGLAASGGIVLIPALGRAISDRAIRRVAQNPALVRELTEIMATGLKPTSLSPELQAVLSAESGTLQDFFSR